MIKDTINNKNEGEKMFAAPVVEEDGRSAVLAQEIMDRGEEARISEDFSKKTAKDQCDDLAVLANKVGIPGCDFEAAHVLTMSEHGVDLYQAKFIYGRENVKDHPYLGIEDKVRTVLQGMADELYSGKGKGQEEAIAIATKWLSKVSSPSEYFNKYVMIAASVYDFNLDRGKQAFEAQIQKNVFPYFFKLGVKEIMPQIEKAYKLHLYPLPEATYSVTKSLMELIRDDDYLREHVREFKVMCEQDVRVVADDPDALPRGIVIYPKLNSTPQGGMNVVLEIAKRLQKKMQVFEGKAWPISANNSRQSFPVDKLISVLQGDSTFKRRLQEFEDLGYSKEDSLLDYFFDKKTNYAFSKSSSLQAEQLFGDIQSDEAKRFIGDCGKNGQVINAPTPNIEKKNKVLAWFSKFFKGGN